MNTLRGTGDKLLLLDYDSWCFLFNAHREIETFGIFESVEIFKSTCLINGCSDESNLKGVLRSISLNFGGVL